MAVNTAAGVCPTCHQLLKICLSCGRPVRGKIHEFDGVGPYCKSCVQKSPGCDVCGAPLVDKHWQLSDGRVICAHCQETAINIPTVAVVLYEEMKSIVARQLGMRLNVPTGLALADRNQLREIIHQQQENNKSGGMDQQELDANRTLGIYARRGMRRGIYVQTGLPRTLFLQVAAHEYAHAWHGENCPLLRDVEMHEGFAEWVAYRVLGYYGYSQGQKLMRDRDDIYGRGLRWALELESGEGASGVIEACERLV